MGVFSKRVKNNRESVEGGKLYKAINTCAIIGLFVAVAIIVLMFLGTIKLTSSVVGIVIAIAILCFSCILALPWIRKIENNEFKILSYVFLGIVAVSCILWIVSDIVVISQYKAIKGAMMKGSITPEEDARLLSGIIASLNYLKSAIFISIQFSVASFVATTITKYKKTMLPFQVITYVSYLFCDFWISGFIFSINIKKTETMSGFSDVADVFSLNQNFLKFLTSKTMITLFILFIAFVILSNTIMKRQETRRMKNATETLENGTKGESAQVADKAPSETPEEKLRKLKDMFEKELITKEEYEAKKSDILKDM